LLLSLFAGAPQAPVKIELRIESPAFVGMPIWVVADLKESWVARYPFDLDLRNVGSNKVELRRNGALLPPASSEPRYKTLVSSGGIMGSIAPTSPPNRLPHHLKFSIDAPGRYAVRWTLERVTFEVMTGSENPIALAHSDWLEFEVRLQRPASESAGSRD
jgi:hypothetical protein